MDLQERQQDLHQVSLPSGGALDRNQQEGELVASTADTTSLFISTAHFPVQHRIKSLVNHADQRPLEEERELES